MACGVWGADDVMARGGWLRGGLGGWRLAGAGGAAFFLRVVPCPARAGGQVARFCRAWRVRWPLVMARSRLWTVTAKVHSASALRWPRMDSWRKPRLCLMLPWGVSAMWPRWR